MVKIKGSNSRPKEQKKQKKNGSKSEAPKEQEEPVEKKGGSESESPKEQKEPMFTFRCLGGEIVRVDPRCFYESETLLLFLEDVDDIRKNPDPRFANRDERDISDYQDVDSPKHIILLFIDYCVGRFKIMKTHQHDNEMYLLSRKLRDFDSKFIRDKSLTTLVLLLRAAIYLKIKSLMNLSRNSIVDLHLGQFADRIPNIYNKPYLKNPKLFFSSYCETWALDGISHKPRRQKAQPRNMDGIPHDPSCQKARPRNRGRSGHKLAPRNMDGIRARLPKRTTQKAKHTDWPPEKFILTAYNDELELSDCSSNND